MALSTRQRSKQKIIPIGNIYRQKFEAEVQLVSALDMSYNRLHCHEFKSPIQTLTGRPLLPALTHTAADEKSTSGTSKFLVDDDDYLTCFKKSESQDDGEAVRELPSIVGANVSASGILERVNRKKEMRHREVWEDMQQHLGLVANEVEKEIEVASCVLKRQLEENDILIQRFLTALQNDEDLVLMKMSELSELWSDISMQNLVRQDFIQQFDDTMARLETYRMEKVRLIFEAIALELERIGHVVGHNLQRLLDKECQMINQTILSNKRSYADLVSNLLMSDIESERSHYKYWQERVVVWREHHISVTVSRFKSYIESDEVKSSPCVQSAMETLVCRLKQLKLHQLELLNQVGCLMPPDFTRDAISEKFKKIHEISQKIDLVCQESFHQLSLEYEKICQEGLREMDKVKIDLLAQEICCDRRATQVTTEQCLPLVSELQAGIEIFLSDMDIHMQEENEKILRVLKELYEHIIEVAEVWEKHESELIQCQSNLQQRLNESRDSHDTHVKSIETSLEAILIKLRQGSTTSLAEHLANALKTLEQVKDSYEKFDINQKEVLSGYSELIITEVARYDNELCKYYNVERQRIQEASKTEQLKAIEIIKVSENAANGNDNNISVSRGGDKSEDKNESVLVMDQQHTEESQVEAAKSSKDEISKTCQDEIEADKNFKDENDGNVPVSSRNVSNDFNKLCLDHSMLAICKPAEDSRKSLNRIVTENGTVFVVVERKIVSRKMSNQNEDVPPAPKKNKNRNNNVTGDENLEGEDGESSFGGSSLSDAGEGRESPQDDALGGKTFLTELEEEESVAEEIPEYLAALRLDDFVIERTRSSIRYNLLNHLEKWKEESATKAKEVIERKSEELTNELQLRLHIHNSRPQFVERNIRDVRAAELQQHAEEIKRHVSYCDQTMNGLKEYHVKLVEQHNDIVAEYRSRMERFETVFVTATRSNQPVDCLEKLETDKIAFVNDYIRSSISQFRDHVAQTMQQLQHATTQLIKSFKLFSNEGNYSPEEISFYTKQLNALTVTFDKFNSQITALITPIESKRLEEITKIQKEFEERFRAHTADLQFIESIRRWFSNTQVKVKGEVNACNTQWSGIQSLVQQLEADIAACLNPHADQQKIRPSQLTEGLPTLFEKLHSHSVYLRCLKDSACGNATMNTITPTTPQMEKSVSPGEENKPTEPVYSRMLVDGNTPLSIAGRQSEDPSVAVIKQILKTQKERIARLLPKIEEKQPEDTKTTNTPTEAGKTKKGKGGKPGKEKPAKNMKADKAKAAKMKEIKKVNVFAEMEVVKDEEKYLMGRIKIILREALEALLTTAEIYYRQKGNRPTTRPHLIQETFDECSTVLTDKCLAYFKQSTQLRDRNVMDLRETVLRLERLTSQIPACIVRDLLQTHLCRTSNQLSQIDADFRKQGNLLSKLKESNMEELRPILGHPQHILAMGDLCCREEDRSSQLIQLIYAHDDQIQEELFGLGQEFITSLAHCTESLFQLLDGLPLVDEIEMDKEPPATRLSPHELIRRRRCDQPLFDALEQPAGNRGPSTWTGLTGAELAASHCWIDFEEIAGAKSKDTEAGEERLNLSNEAPGVGILGATEGATTGGVDGKNYEKSRANSASDKRKSGNTNRSVDSTEESNEDKPNSVSNKTKDVTGETADPTTEADDLAEELQESKDLPVTSETTSRYQCYMPEPLVYVPRKAARVRARRCSDKETVKLSDNSADKMNNNSVDEVTDNSSDKAIDTSADNAIDNSVEKVSNDSTRNNEDKAENGEQAMNEDSEHGVKTEDNNVNSVTEYSKKSDEKLVNEETEIPVKGDFFATFKSFEPVTTSKTHEALNAVCTEREHAYQVYKSYYESQLSELYALTELCLYNEVRWQHYWTTSVCRVRQLYK